MFPLAWEGYNLSLGDFSAFEVTIADAVCNDEALRAELLAGRKIHALFGMALFPGKTYEEIKASDGTDNDMYTKGKQGFFGTMLYGGDHSTLVNKLGIKEDVAKAAIENFGSRFVGVKKWRQRVADSFCSMRQPGGIGTQVVFTDPADYCETFLGFRRYFSLENAVAKTLFKLANSPPKHWKDCKIKVVRRDRVQTAGGAVQSALYGAAFSMQAANMRAAANHEIQSPGTGITKAVQRRIWDLQPAGVHEIPCGAHECPRRNPLRQSSLHRGSGGRGRCRGCRELPIQSAAHWHGMVQVCPELGQQEGRGGRRDRQDQPRRDERRRPWEREEKGSGMTQIRRPHEGPERKIQRALIAFLNARGWLVERMIGNAFQMGIPDLFVAPQMGPAMDRREASGKRLQLYQGATPEMACVGKGWHRHLDSHGRRPGELRPSLSIAQLARLLEEVLG